MCESLCFSRAANAEENSPLQDFDNVVATMKPAKTRTPSPESQSLSLLSGEFVQGAATLPSVSRSTNLRASADLKIREKDRTIAALQRQVQDTLSRQRELEKCASAREAQVALFEKNSETAARRILQTEQQLRMVRAQLERFKHRAITEHRRQEQRILELEQVASRKLGLTRSQVGSQQDILVNPLTGKPIGSVNCSPQCAMILHEAADARRSIEAKVCESNKLVALCELLENTFVSHQATFQPPANVMQRLEVAVTAAVELLEVILQHQDELSRAHHTAESLTGQSYDSSQLDYAESPRWQPSDGATSI